MSNKYKSKSYGRNEEIKEIFAHFEQGRDIHMPGARRLGKSFTLDRLVEHGIEKGWNIVKVDVAGYQNVAQFYQSLSQKIEQGLPGWWKKQRLKFEHKLQQLTKPSEAHQQAKTTAQILLHHDHEQYFEKIIEALAQKQKICAILIDELPIFLKSMHDQGKEGIVTARNLMNNLNRIRAAHPSVRWLITGSIGIEPLAKQGEYQGALAKFQVFNLETLTTEQATDFLQDVILTKRPPLSDFEIQAIIRETGWLSAYYLEQFALCMVGSPASNQEEADQQIEKALEELLHPNQSAIFAYTEEHIRKHYPQEQKLLAYTILNTLAKQERALSADQLQGFVSKNTIDGSAVVPLGNLLLKLEQEGFIRLTKDQAEHYRLLNPLLARRLRRYPLGD